MECSCRGKTKNNIIMYMDSDVFKAFRMCDLCYEELFVRQDYKQYAVIVRDDGYMSIIPRVISCNDYNPGAAIKYFIKCMSNNNKVLHVKHISETKFELEWILDDEFGKRTVKASYELKYVHYEDSAYE